MFYYKYQNTDIKIKITRWVLSETKAIMSPPVCPWMEANFFVEEGELIN